MRPCWLSVAAILSSCVSNSLFPDGPVPAVCGDGVSTGGEACDDGPGGSVDCTLDCQRLFCGDGVLTPPREECDDNSLEGDGCTDCVIHADELWNVPLQGVPRALVGLPSGGVVVALQGAALLRWYDAYGAAGIEVPVGAAGAGLIEPEAVAADAAGGVIVVGEERPVRTGTLYRGFVVAATPSGQVAWSASEPSSSTTDNRWHDVAVGPAGAALAGSWKPGTSMYAYDDAMMARYAANGLRLWRDTASSPVNGPQDAYCAAIDGAGTVYVAGSRYRSDWWAAFGDNGALLWEYLRPPPGDLDDFSRFIDLRFSDSGQLLGLIQETAGTSRVSIDYGSGQMTIDRQLGPDIRAAVLAEDGGVVARTQNEILLFGSDGTEIKRWTLDRDILAVAVGPDRIFVITNSGADHQLRAIAR